MPADAKGRLSYLTGPTLTASVRFEMLHVCNPVASWILIAMIFHNIEFSAFKSKQPSQFPGYPRVQQMVPGRAFKDLGALSKHSPEILRILLPEMRNK